MSTKVLNRKKENIYLASGDTISVWEGNELLLEEAVTKSMHVTEVGIFEFEDEFGLTEGIGGYFGRE